MATNFGSDPGLSGSIPKPLITVGPDYAVNVGTILDSVLDRWTQSIGTADIDIDSSLDMNSNLLTNLSGSSHIDHSSSVDGGLNPRLSYFRDGEFYINDSSGNEVKITDSGALNASLLGGIGGDYTTTSADVSYVNASGSYFFTSAPNSAAQIDIGDLRVKRGTNTFGVRFRTTSDLAADYDLTLPAAVPTSTSVVVMDVTGSLNLTRDLSIGNVTVTGSYYHGGQRLHVSAAAMATDGTNIGRYCTLISGDSAWVPVSLKTDDKITGLNVYFRHSVSATGGVTFQLRSFTSGTASTEEGPFNITSTATEWSVDERTGLSTTLVEGRNYYVEVINISGTTEIPLVEIIYERVEL